MPAGERVVTTFSSPIILDCCTRCGDSTGTLQRDSIIDVCVMDAYVPTSSDTRIYDHGSFRDFHPVSLVASFPFCRRCADRELAKTVWMMRTRRAANVTGIGLAVIIVLYATAFPFLADTGSLGERIGMAVLMGTLGALLYGLLATGLVFGVGWLARYLYGPDRGRPAVRGKYFTDDRAVVPGEPNAKVVGDKIHRLFLSPKAAEQFAECNTAITIRDR